MRSEQIENYTHYLKMLFNGHVNSVLCHSKAGLGKTYTTIKLLKQHSQQYKYSSGIATAVGLYKLLYDNNDKVLVLDDIETIFQDERIINLLKAALWDVDGKRVVSYKSSSKTLEDYPDEFIYTGKIIILANEIKGKVDESYKALMSRCLKYELTYTYKEILEIAKVMVLESNDLNPSQKTKVVDIMCKNINPQHSFNFRLLRRLIAFVKYDMEKSEALFLSSLDVDEEISILIDVIKNNDTVSEQVKAYKQLTGQSRMTFFRKKKKLKADGVI